MWDIVVGLVQSDCDSDLKELCSSGPVCVLPKAALKLPREREMLLGASDPANNGQSQRQSQIIF